MQNIDKFLLGKDEVFCLKKNDILLLEVKTKEKDVYES